MSRSHHQAFLSNKEIVELYTGNFFENPPESRSDEALYYLLGGIHAIPDQKERSDYFELITKLGKDFIENITKYIASGQPPKFMQNLLLKFTNTTTLLEFVINLKALEPTESAEPIMPKQQNLKRQFLRGFNKYQEKFVSNHSGRTSPIEEGHNHDIGSVPDRSGAATPSPEERDPDENAPLSFVERVVYSSQRTSSRYDFTKLKPENVADVVVRGH